jgi:enoyl-[acyl-carrier-protein] reductase (NADH)
MSLFWEHVTWTGITILLTAIIAPLIVWYSQRRIDKREAKKAKELSDRDEERARLLKERDAAVADALKAKDAVVKEIDTKWHETVAESFKRMELTNKEIDIKLTSFCRQNNEVHNELIKTKNEQEKRIVKIEETHHQRGCDQPYPRRIGETVS